MRDGYILVVLLGATFGGIVAAVVCLLMWSEVLAAQHAPVIRLQVRDEIGQVVLQQRLTLSRLQANKLKP